MTQVSYETWREILKNETLPATVVDLDAFDRNCEKLAEICVKRSKTLRIATKSLRVPSLISRVLKRGGPFVGLMCYSAHEAEFLAGLGNEFNDFLIAYPVLNAGSLAALRRLHENGKKVRLIVDSNAGIAAVSAAMKGLAKPFELVIDIDVSLRWLGGLVHLGVRRSPVRTASDVARLLVECKKHASIRCVGAMAYEAQVAGLGDRNPFKKLLNPIAGWVRRISVKSVARTRVQIAAAMGSHLEIFNGGGSGSFNFAAQENVLTELTAGSGLLCSHLFDYYSNIQFEAACFFALETVRSSDPGFITALGGGYIASGEPGWDRVPLPVMPVGLSMVSTEGAGEVQTPLQVQASSALQLGDPVLFRHAKAGELAERFNRYLLVSNKKVIESAPTYRGLGQCFL